MHSQIEYLSNSTRREPQGRTIDFNKKDRAKRYHKSSIFNLQFRLVRVGCVARFSMRCLRCLYSLWVNLIWSDRRSICLWRLVCPAIISREDFETPRHLARNLRHIWLAALLTGGAVSFILRASLCSPAIIFFEDFGCTRTLNTRPSGFFLMFSPSFFSTANFNPNCANHFFWSY